MNRLLLVFTASFLIAASSLTASAEPAANTAGEKTNAYTITVIPYYSPEKIWAKFAPLIEHLKQSTGLPWELKLYHNHAALLEGLCSGEVSFALLGSVPLGRAIDRCNVKTVAVALGKDGKPSYRSVLLTSDPSVKSIALLKGKRFGLFKGSSAAHIMPLKMLKDAGVVDTDIIPVFYESQDRIMSALLEREVAAAGVKEALYQKFKSDRLVVLKTSDPLPGFAIASAPGLSEAMKKRLTKALLKLEPLKNQQDRRLMQEWDDEIKNGFIAPPNDYRTSVINALSAYNEIVHEDK